MQLKTCTPAATDHRHLALRQVNPEPQLHFQISDVPASDVEGGEAHPDYYQITCRVPGGEEFFVIEREFGGVIKSTQKKLETTVNIRQWLNAHRAELTEIEGGQLRVDGDYDFQVCCIDRNGFSSEPSETHRFTLSMTSPEPPKVTVTPVPLSIVQTAFAQFGR